MICNSCKFEYDDSARFCPRCGVARSYTSSTDGPSYNTSGSSSDMPFFVPGSYQPRRSFGDESVRRFLIGFAIVAVVVVALVVGLIIHQVRS